MCLCVVYEKKKKKYITTLMNIIYEVNILYRNNSQDNFTYK